MLSSEDRIKQIVWLNYNTNDMNEKFDDIRNHIESQMTDGMIKWIEKEERVIAYADYFWLKDFDDVYLYEQLGICPNGGIGEILYINNCVINSPDKRLVWELLKLRPKSEYICWKRNDDKLKIWRIHHDKKFV